MSLRRVAALLAGAGIWASALVGCGSRHPTASTSRLARTLLAETRPLGSGPRFRPPVGPVSGRCSHRLGARVAVHVELFAANHAVLVPAGIGTRPPRSLSAGRIVAASCFGDLVTLEPSGVVLVRPGSQMPLAELFRAWSQPLSRRRLGPFRASAGSSVTAFLNGRPWHGSPGSVPLAEHSEIVLEVGAHVPPHASYAFPPGT